MPIHWKWNNVNISVVLQCPPMPRSIQGRGAHNHWGDRKCGGAEISDCKKWWGHVPNITDAYVLKSGNLGTNKYLTVLKYFNSTSPSSGKMEWRCQQLRHVISVPVLFSYQSVPRYPHTEEECCKVSLAVRFSYNLLPSFSLHWTR